MGLFRRSKGEAEADASRKVAETELEANDASRGGVYLFFLAMFAAGFLAVLFATFAWVSPLTIAASVVAGFVLATSVRVAPHWERVAILRFGKFNRVAGPGIVFTWPIVEFYTLRVDQRVSATYFGAEETLTSDLVPINVDAVLFWVVWDAEKACTEVEDYYAAVSFLAQTAMREAVGRSTVAEVALRRDQLDIEIKEDIEKEAAGWGVDVISVKVRDIRIPDELQEAMSLEAQADREKNARMSVASVEGDLAEMLAEAARVYGDPDAALKLRTMLMQYDTVKKSKSAVVTVPSSFSDGFADAADKGGANGSGRAPSGAAKGGR